MKVSIIGSGNMARALTTRFTTGGHEVDIHAQLADHGKELVEAMPSELREKISVQNMTDEISGEVVVLAVPYAAVNDVLEKTGASLTGKIVVDITNPLDWTTMESVVPAGQSAAELIAAKIPQAHVVKAFNTVFASLLASGKVAGQPVDVFIAGDDASRKVVSQLVTDGKMRPIDAGVLAHARQLEGMSQMLIITHGQVSQPFAAGLKIVS